MQTVYAVWFAMLLIPLALVATSPAWIAGKLAARLRPMREPRAMAKTSLRRWAGFMISAVTAGVSLVTLAMSPHPAPLLLSITAVCGANYFAFMIAAASGFPEDAVITTSSLDRPVSNQKLDDMDMALMALMAGSDKK